MGDRRRDPRRGPDEARGASVVVARAPGAPGGRAAPEDRPLGHAKAPRGGRALPGRPEPRLPHRRHRRAQGARPRDPGASGGHARARRPRPHRPESRRHGHHGGRRRSGGPGPGRRRHHDGPERARAEHTTKHLARHLPRAALADQRAQVHNRLRQQPPRRRAAGGQTQRARPGGHRPRPPRLPGPRGAPGGGGPPQVGRPPLPGRHLEPRARHRHGGRGPGAAGRVAEVGDGRAPAHRPGRPRRRRGVEGADLPEVPRGPARVRGGREAHARGPDRGDGDSPQPARRPGPADRGDGGERGLERSRAVRGGAPRLSVRGAEQGAARPGARHARWPLPERGVRGAAPPHRVGSRGGHDPRPQGRPPAGRDQRRHDPRPGSLRGAPARRPACRRARRGDGLRGPPGPDVPAWSLHLANRGDHSGQSHRHAGAGRAGRGAVLEGRRHRPACGARKGDRRVHPLGRGQGAGGARRRLSTSSRARPRTW